MPWNPRTDVKAPPSRTAGMTSSLSTAPSASPSTPVAPRFGYRIDATEACQNLEDWTSAEAAQKLRVFSAAANKSTGVSHPMDQRRWFDFVIAVHESRKTIGTDLLIRWLHEIEGWDEESAHELAGQYETALSLLQRYDER